MPGTFNTTQLLQALESLHRPPRFLLDMFFPDVVLSDSKEVSFDLENDVLDLAPFVSPIVAGKAKRTEGFQTKSFTPAYIKPKNHIDPSAPLVRRPGEPIAGAIDAGTRRNLLINQTMLNQSDRIDRRKEWMAAQVLTTGKVVVEGEGYAKQEVDFGRKTAHKKTLTSGARWGESGVSPFDNIDTWSDLIAEEVGAGVDIVVMGKDAWKLLRADPNFLAALDRDRGQNHLAELGYQTGMPGAPQWKGTVGDIAFYTYNGIFKDDAGATQKMLDSYGVLLAATGAHAGRQYHGAILDGAAGYQALQIFPKNWIEQDPALEFVMSQSAPLMVPGRPNATVYVKVR